MLMSLNMLIEFGDGFDYSGADFRKWCHAGRCFRRFLIHIDALSAKAKLKHHVIVRSTALGSDDAELKKGTGDRSVDGISFDKGVAAWPDHPAMNVAPSGLPELLRSGLPGLPGFLDGLLYPLDSSLIRLHSLIMNPTDGGKREQLPLPSTK